MILKSYIRTVYFLLTVVFIMQAGAYEIGHRNMTFTDPARSRDIQTEVYYPADMAGDDVPFASGIFQIISFGHGFLIPWSDYSYLWEGLVPNGYIVIFPRTEGGISPDHEDLGLDLAFLIDHLILLGADSGSIFFGHIDDSAAIMGHSMGGGASFLGAGQSDNVTVISNFAAAETNPSAIDAAASLEMPALLLAGTEDCVTPPDENQIPMYDALISTCKTLVTITGGSHCQFAENNGTCTFGEAVSGCSPAISLEEQESRTLSLLLPWLNFFLKNDPGAWPVFESALTAGSGSGDWNYQQDCPQPTPTPTVSPTPTPTPLTPTPSPPPPLPSASPAALGFLIFVFSIGLLIRR